ncbi:MAG TPA: hypothetical protein VME24_06310 [Alphaproteobacteria bacterium]|nr:hypothetical protein [Alphaproteobacteria bacterium]
MKKKTFIILSFFATGFLTFGVIVSEFRGWNDLVQTSPDIIVARCASTYSAKPSSKNVVIVDDVIWSDIDVLSILKGNTKPGPARLASQFWPYPEQQFAVFGGYSDGRYSAVESYRVVPIRRDFPLNVLNGKTLTEQVQIILSNRLSDLNEEIGQEEVEKFRIQEYLKEK